MCKLQKILYSYSGKTFLQRKIFQGEKVKKGQTKYANHASYLQNILPSREPCQTQGVSLLCHSEKGVTGSPCFGHSNRGARRQPCPTDSTARLSTLTFTLKNIRHPGPSGQSQGKHHCKKLSFLEAIFAFLEIGSVLPRPWGGLGGGAVTEPH